MSAVEIPMTGSDEALLRQLIGQVSALTAKVDGLCKSMEEKFVERRKHADGLEARLLALELRVHAMELTGAEGKSLPERVDDHEGRIRSLENIRWQLLAIAFLGSGAGYLVTSILRLL